MIKVQSPNTAFYWASTFLRKLYQTYVQHIVISPGSRSTPLTLAAAAFPPFQKHVVLDERSAAYFALGIGKATGQPAALICTSGTAVANYFPAVIEARKSGVPLLLLTADRPAHLCHTGANQTINQQHIFGEYPVLFQDVGEPEMRPHSLQNLEQLAVHAVHQSKKNQGPVHLNFPFQKPLEPNEDFLQEITAQNQALQVQSSPQRSKDKSTDVELDDDVLSTIHDAERPLIIVGQLPPAANIENIFDLAKAINAPVLSEQGCPDQQYAIRGFEGLLRNEQNRSHLQPDLILRFGRQPASKSLLQAIVSWDSDVHLHFSTTDETSNIENTTTDFISWNGNAFTLNPISGKPSNWLNQWKESEKRYAKMADKLLGDTDILTDGHVYHHLTPSIPDNWSVSISNSFPARDQSMFGRWKNHKIFTNRGVSGIDGITSTAMGVNIGLDGPGILFIGDLAFLHDTNGLLNHRKLSHPLVIVVINNQGGSIFRMLPIAKHEEQFSTYFETPQQADIMILAKTYGIPATRVTSVSELSKIDICKVSNNSDSNLQIIECQTATDASMDLRNKLWSNNSW